MNKKNAPVIFDLDDDTVVSPQTAPVIEEIAPLPTGQAMQTVAALAVRPGSRLFKWFWRLFIAIAGFGLSVWAWDFLTALVDRNVYLGGAAVALVTLFLLVCLLIVLREWAAFSRLARLDTLNSNAQNAYASDDLKSARNVSDKLVALYKDRPEVAWGIQRIGDLSPEILDADGVLGLAESGLMAPLDAAARIEIENAARQVATVTAIVPLAFADVIAALTVNIRMIRRIAEIYGGRSGTLGSWRLTRTVLTHLVATGAVAVGDDLIGSIAGGGVLSKVSRRFGEGVINGALTGRVGVAAMEVCRPLPFRALKRPKITSLVQRALTGLFATSKAPSKASAKASSKTPE